MNMKRIIIRSLGLVAAIGAVGCMDPKGLGAPDATQMPSDPIVAKAKSYQPASPAGVSIPTASGPLWVQLIASQKFSSRPDPFALQAKERNWENRQITNRIFDQDQWRYDFTPEETPPVIPETEPQPYRRLAGVIVGDSVLALIDMGDGKLQLIRPGQDIDGWHVESITAEGPSGTAEAILTRGGNKLPHRVTVRLEEPSPIGGANPGGRGRGGNNGGGGVGSG
jgi:hypothetical protein